MKTCFKCGETQPLTEFYHNRGMSDGRVNKCKNCTRRDIRARELRLLNDPQWRLSELRRHREKSRRYRAEGKRPNQTPQQKREAILRYFDKHPLKKAAKDAVSRALRSVSLHKQACEVCGCTKTQAHHDDYTKPLDVRWLCVPHHNEHHVKMRELQILTK